MTSQLHNKTKNIILIENLKVAKSFKDRAKGLIGRKSLSTNEAMMFPKTNWIHTFFMSVPIDVVYLDKHMKVKKTDKHMKPWKLGVPVFRASHVIEFKSGLIDRLKIEKGDELNVGH